jgi:hypothetical protein
MSTDRESGMGNKRARVTKGSRNPKHGKRKALHCGCFVPSLIWKYYSRNFYLAHEKQLNKYQARGMAKKEELASQSPWGKKANNGMNVALLQSIS